MLLHRLSCVLAGVAGGAGDFRTVYTPVSWGVAWLLRVIMQVAYFALLGAFVGGQSRARFLLVGMAVGVVAMESMTVVVSTTWERRFGTLPLLAWGDAAFYALIGKGLFWVVSAVASGFIALVAVSNLMGTAIAHALAVPLLLLVALSVYAFGLALASVALWIPQFRNILSNASYLSLTALCGCVVEVEYWPPVVQAAVQVLPVTHGLAGIRLLLEGGRPAQVLTFATLELAVVVVWLLIGRAALTLSLRTLRHSGRSDFGF